MENKPFDYKSLTKNGLQLSENDYNLILDSLTNGAEEAKKYLGVTSDPWPKFNFSNDSLALGYSSRDDMICLSLSHLNQAVSRSSQLEFKDQLIMFIPDVFYIIVKYIYWLRLLGREATIHRYQKFGNPLLFKQFPDKLPASVSRKALILSDVEVEARKIIDAIILQKEENPIWENVDTYFSKNYPQYYNKSIEELAKLPKPEFPISFEMEYYAI